jgi:hypothetical protein
MNPTLTELHATARRNQLLAHAERHRLVRQARVQRRTRSTTADTVTTVSSWLGLGRKPGVVEAHAA